MPTQSGTFLKEHHVVHEPRQKITGAILTENRHDASGATHTDAQGVQNVIRNFDRSLDDPKLY